MPVVRGEGMDRPLRILLVEDQPLDAELLERGLCRGGLQVSVVRVDTHALFRRALEDFLPQVILSDSNLPQFDGLDALALARKEAPNTPFIFVSGEINEERMAVALQEGAADYVLKDSLEQLISTIVRSLEAVKRAAPGT